MNVLQLPADMLVDLAMGVTPAIDIVAKYGYSVEDYMRMSTYAWFHKAVEEKRTEIEAKGFSFQSKMGMMAELLLVDAFIAAQQSESANVKLDVAKYLTKISGLEPQPGVGVAAGGGFSITINLGANKSVTVNASPQEQRDQIEDATVLDDILPPTTLTLLPHITNDDLSANA